MDSQLTIYCDGGARGNPGPAAAAFVVEKEGKAIFKDAKFLGNSTNNVAEYSAVILALTWLLQKSNIQARSGLLYSVFNVQFILDSELVSQQLSGNYKVKNENLKSLFFTVKKLEQKFPGKIFYLSVPRHKNKLADFLVNASLDNNS